jgi:diguanylate cyclase (GGDEF)-like protein
VRQTANLAASLAQQTASSLETTDAVLQRMYFWANLRGVAPAQRQLLRDLLSVRTPSMKPIEDLAFFDAAGTAVVRSGPVPSAVTLETERRAFAYHAGHASLDPWVAAPPSSVSDRAVTLSRRFDDHHGKFGGMVVATISIPSIRRLFDEVDIGHTGVIVLTLRDGATILRRPRRALGVIADRNDEIAARAAGASYGSLRGRSPIDREDRIVAFRRVDGFPLIIAVAFGTAETVEGWFLSSIVGFLGACAAILTIVLLARALLAELARSARAREQLVQFASRDGLTGLFNRREFDVAIEREWQAGLRDGLPLAVLMLDVDKFKQYNDRFGHQLGDAALTQVATCLRRRCSRPRDVVARYGGEEFIALLPSTSLAGARRLAENVRRDVAGSIVEHGAPVTVSLGVAEMIPTSERLPADLIRAADQLLYEAKRTGRNKVVSHATTSAPGAPVE